MPTVVKFTKEHVQGQYIVRVIVCKVLVSNKKQQSVSKQKSKSGEYVV